MKKQLLIKEEIIDLLSYLFKSFQINTPKGVIHMYIIIHKVFSKSKQFQKKAKKKHAKRAIEYIYSVFSKILR